MKIRILALLALAGATASLPAVVLDDGHLDIALNYSGGWTAGLHHDDSGQTYEPADTVLYASTAAYPAGSGISRPAGSTWDFIGVGAGETFYFFPQNQQSGILWPGFSSEETDPGTLASYAETDPRVSSGAAPWITVQLTDVQYYGEGDGAFSLWSTGTFGSPTVWMSTANGGITASDKFLFLEGGHTHMNWGFGDIGFYELTFTVSAFLNDGLMTPVSSEVTLQFGIGTTVIPEPQTLGLVVLAAAFLALRKRTAAARL